jgi:hypothetical protein
VHAVIWLRAFLARRFPRDEMIDDEDFAFFARRYALLAARLITTFGLTVDIV